jgi:hypothetical protein
MRRLLAVLALVVGACSLSTDGPPPPTALRPALATITLSGALTGTYSGLVTLSSVSTTQTTWALVGPVSPLIGGVIRLNGVPSIRDYTQADSGANASLAVSTGTTMSDHFWAAATSGGGLIGSYTLRLTTVSAAVTTPDGSEYACHGTLDATLSATTPADGSVITLRATF